MLFCLIHWQQIVGIQWFLSGCVLCLSAFIIPRCCINRKGIKRWGTSMLACELVGSGIWQLIFYQGGQYHDYGLQGGFFFLVYPALLIISWVIITQYPKLKAKYKEKL